MFITYDLQQTEGGPNSKEAVVARGAKEVPIYDKLVSWEVGEFEMAPGKKVYGVRINYGAVDAFSPMRYEIVEIPANAQNVEVHSHSVPAEYRSALKTAA